MNARPRGDAIKKLDSLGERIMEHIVKVSIFPDHASVKHWQSELDAWKNRLIIYNKAKSGSQNYTPEILFEAIYENHGDKFPTLDMLESYGQHNALVDIDAIKMAVVAFSEAVMKG